MWVKRPGCWILAPIGTHSQQPRPSLAPLAAPLFFRRQEGEAIGLLARDLSTFPCRESTIHLTYSRLSRVKFPSTLFSYHPTLMGAAWLALAPWAIQYLRESKEAKDAKVPWPPHWPLAIVFGSLWHLCYMGQD